MPDRRASTALVMLGLSVLLTGCGSEKPAPTPPRPVAWTTVQADEGDELRRLPGVLRAARQAPLSFEVPGRVVEVNAEIGESFAAGDALAALDDRNFRLTLEERRANLADARARLTEADKNLARKRELLARKVASQAAVDSAQATRDSAAAQVARLRALVDLAEEDLADVTLDAPYDGSVLQRMIEPSQQVQAGQTVFQIEGRSDRIEVIVSAPETVVNRLSVGDDATLAFPSRPGLSLTARVSEIGAGAVERNAFPVTLVLSSPPATLRPGMTAEVGFRLQNSPTSEGQMTFIPVTAFLAAEGELRRVFVIDPESSRLEARAVDIGSIENGRARVLDGLAPGEIIVSKGLAFLHDGQRVQRLGTGTTRFQE